MREKLVHPIEAAGVTVPNNLWFAPLAGYSYHALRVTAKKHGAGLTYTEMISVEGVVRGDKRTMRMAAPEDGNTAVQLFGGAEPEKFHNAAKIMMREFGYKIVDINFGCPVRKVIRIGAGSCLLKEPSAMGEIVRAVKETGAVVSAKIRAGYSCVYIEKTIPIIDDAGADIIIVHPRLATQMFGGAADWELISRAREMTGRILIGNGDIDSPETALARLRESRVDGIMVGRAAIAKPYLFRLIADLDATGSYVSPSLPEVRDGLIEFARLFIATSNARSMSPLRSAVLSTVKSMGNSREVRGKVSSITTLDELIDALDGWHEREGYPHETVTQ